MKLTDYHATAPGLQRNASPAEAEAVADLEERLRAALVGSGLFHTVEVDHTDDVDRLVIALVQFAPDVDAAHVAWQLERLWHDVLSYPFWTAESVLVEEGQVELQGATRSSQHGSLPHPARGGPGAPVPTSVPQPTSVIPAQGTGRPTETPPVPTMPAQSAAPASRPAPRPARRRRLLGRP